MFYFWQQIPSPQITEMLCTPVTTNGIVLDLEHGCFNPETLHACIQVATLAGSHVLISIPPLKHGSAMIAQMALDAGATGIIMKVENRTEADGFLELCLYSEKRSQGYVRENYWGRDIDITSIHGERDSDIYLIPRISSYDGYKNLDDIMDDLFSYYMIGPYDMTASLGCAGDFDNQEFEEVITELHEKIGDKLAYHITDKDLTAENVRTFAEKCGFLAIGADTLFLLEGIEKLTQAI